MTLDPRRVAVVRTAATYPDVPPYSPDERYPEAITDDVAASSNTVYAAVREAFRVAGLDAEHVGTATWNPLGDHLRQGQTVLLKPNMVKEYHPRFPDGWQIVLTHGSVIRAVADYVWKAIGPQGRVVIADAPQSDSSFDKVSLLLGLEQLQRHYASHGMAVEVIDLRRAEWIAEGGVIVQRRNLPGDPRGNVAYDLGDRSEFVGHRGGGRYYGADYDAGEVNGHHQGGHHEYLIAGSVVACDAIVSIPKLKTHKKAGITVSLKNLIGVNGDKNWLPHHTEGDAASGGDERPMLDLVGRAERRAVGVLRRITIRFPLVGPKLFKLARRGGTPIAGSTGTTVRSGNWFGNDTLWRTCLDLNKIVLYGEPDGTVRPAGPKTGDPTSSWSTG